MHTHNDAHQEFVCFKRSKKVHYIEGRKGVRLEIALLARRCQDAKMPRCQAFSHKCQANESCDHDFYLGRQHIRIPTAQHNLIYFMQTASISSVLK